MNLHPFLAVQSEGGNLVMPLRASFLDSKLQNKFVDGLSMQLGTSEHDEGQAPSNLHVNKQLNRRHIVMILNGLKCHFTLSRGVCLHSSRS